MVDSESDSALNMETQDTPVIDNRCSESSSSKLVLPDIKCYILIASVILQTHDGGVLTNMAERILSVSGRCGLRFTNVVNTLRLLLSFASEGLSVDIIAQCLEALTPCDSSITSLDTPILSAVHPSLDLSVFLEAVIDPLDPSDSSLQASAHANHSFDCLVADGPNNDDDASTEYLCPDTEAALAAINEIIDWLEPHCSLELQALPVPALVATARDISADILQRCKSRKYWPSRLDLPVQARSRFLRAISATVPANRDPTTVLGPLLTLCSGDLTWRAWTRGQAQVYARSIGFNSCPDFGAFINAAKDHKDQFAMIAWQAQDQVPLFIARVAIPLARYHGQDYEPLMAYLFETGPHMGTSHQFKIWSESLTVLSNRAVPATAFEHFTSRYIASIYFNSAHNDPSHQHFDDILSGLHICANGLQRSSSSLSNSWSVPEITGSIPHYDSFTEFYELSTNPLKPLFDVHSIANGVDFALAAVTTCRRMSFCLTTTLANYLELTLNSDPLPALDTAKSLVAQAVAVDERSWREFVEIVGILSDSHGPRRRESVSAAVYECLLKNNLFDAILSIGNDRSWPINAGVLYSLLHEHLWLSLGHASLATALSNANACVRIMDTIELDLAQDQADVVPRLKSLLGGVSKLAKFKVLIDRKVLDPPAIAINMRSLIHCTPEEQRQAVSLLINTILSNNRLSYKQPDQLQEISHDLLSYLGLANSNHESGVTSACIEASLAEEDFEFAYSSALQLVADPEAWVTVYQVAKYQPAGDDESVTQRIDRLLKQRDVLGRALLNATETGSTDALLRQWTTINDEIEEFYSQEPTRETGRDTMSALGLDMSGNSALESGFLSSLEHVGPSLYTAANPAGEKLQNLLISGLGWAIGAQRP